MERALRRHDFWILPAVFFLAVVLTGCEDSMVAVSTLGVDNDASFKGESLSKNVSPAGLTVGATATVATFDAFSGELPEGIAVDRQGNIFVSMSGLGEIWKLDHNGSFEGIVGSFPLNPGDLGVLGLRFDAQGDLYAAVSSTNEDVHGVWQISSSGVEERLAGTSSIAFPNDLAVSPRGTVYITDSAAGSVWRYLPGGTAEIWVQDQALEGTGAFGIGVPIGANGIVVASGRNLPVGSGRPSVGGILVANSEKAQIVHVPILPDGSAGEPIVVIADPAALFGLDGITVDARGTIYGAVNVANTIVRISRDGNTLTEVTSGEPLDFPASLTFGSGRDEHTLFVTSFAIIHFLSDPPMPADADPAVISVHIGAPGRAG